MLDCAVMLSVIILICAAIAVFMGIVVSIGHIIHKREIKRRYGKCWK